MALPRPLLCWLLLTPAGSCWPVLAFVGICWQKLASVKRLTKLLKNNYKFSSMGLIVASFAAILGWTNGK